MLNHATTLLASMDAAANGNAFYALVSVTIVSILALCGVISIPFNKRNVQSILVSLAAGAMLGNVIVHLLPEAFEHAHDDATKISLYVVAGFLGCFLLEKVLNVRCQHGNGAHTHGTGADCTHEQHSHEHGAHKNLAAGHVHPMGYMSLVSHGVHNFTDGVLIATSFMVSVPVGIATTVAIILHEIPMEFGGFGVLMQAGFSRGKAILLNALSGLGALAGTVFTIILGNTVEGVAEVMTPIGAGMVLYLTAAGLIPQMQEEKNAKRSAIQFVVMIVGIAIMVLVKEFAGHSHSH